MVGLGGAVSILWLSAMVGCSPPTSEASTKPTPVTEVGGTDTAEVANEPSTLGPCRPAAWTEPAPAWSALPKEDGGWAAMQFGRYGKPYELRGISYSMLSGTAEGAWPSQAECDSTVAHRVVLSASRASSPPEQPLGIFEREIQAGGEPDAHRVVHIDLTGEGIALHRETLLIAIQLSATPMACLRLCNNDGGGSSWFTAQSEPPHQWAQLPDIEWYFYKDFDIRVESLLLAE